MSAPTTLPYHTVYGRVGATPGDTGPAQAIPFTTLGSLLGSGGGSGGGAGVTYYIAANGNDTNNGTSPATPWQDIAKVNSITPTPGTTFLFRGGDTFTGTITAKASGLPGFPIAYSSYGGGQAIISPGNASGFSNTTGFDNISITNLTFVGAGVNTNTAHAIDMEFVTQNANNFTLSNLNINNFGLCGIAFIVGNPTGTSTTVPVVSNISATNNTIHDCGGDGIRGWSFNNANNNINSFPQWLAFNNALISNNLIYNITGGFTDSRIAVFAVFAGSGIIWQGCNGLTIQNNTVHDSGWQAFLNNIGSLPGIYVSSANNCLIQFNEVYAMAQTGGTSHDAGGIMADFGMTATTIQYNYIHDCASFGIGTGTLQLTIGGFLSTQNNDSTVIRYNVLVNNGTAIPGTFFPPGIAFYTFSAAEKITNMRVYNNTVIGRNNSSTSVGWALITDQAGTAGFSEIYIANNILVGDADTVLVRYNSDSIRFFGNIYVGGSTTAKVIYKNSNIYTTISAWLAATGYQEKIDGVSVATVITDPLFAGSLANPFTYSTQVPPSSPNVGITPARANPWQLAQMSPAANAGIDLSKTLKFQTGFPPLLQNLQGGSTWSGCDFDFKGGVYNGDVIGSISCSRTATTATDLTWDSPLGASFNTFAANTLRITSGKGLLVEGARTQYLATPGTPATQTTASLSAGFYVLWVNGTGLATATAGTATISVPFIPAVATQGAPLRIQVTSPGTVVVTVTGSLNQFQLENDPVQGNQVSPSSFISAIGTRDADVVTTTTASTIGTQLHGFTASGSTAVMFFFKLPGYGPIHGQPNYLLSENNNISFLAIQNNNAFSANATQYVAQMSVGGSTTTTTPTLAAVMQQDTQQVRMAVGANSQGSGSLGQTIVFNGGAITTNANNNSPAVSTTSIIGNSQGGGNPFGGYIERMLTAPFPNWSDNGVSLQMNSSNIPIAPDLAHDLYGNPVPGPGNTFSIGAHQPAGNVHGGTFTANGASAVTVTDASITANSIIFVTLKTVGGTVGALPAIKTITPGTGFTVAATASDTSVYNYMVAN